MKKKSKRASSRLNNPLLPSELIEEILLKLPHKSLVRFSAVSKSWNSMILDPVFARKHKNLSRSHRFVLFFMNEFDEAGAVFSLAPISSDLRIKVIEKRRRDGSDPSFSVISNAKDDVIRDFAGQFEEKPYLLAYCDELWCVQVEKTLFLWNPSMRNIARLPPSSSLLKNSDDFIYGLAYDSANDDYKILQIKRRRPNRTELYSLKNNCWRKIKSFSTSPSFKQRRCEFVGGRFHWIGYTSAEAQIIASFDLSTEKYGEMALPHDDDDDEGDHNELDDDDEGDHNELEVLTLNGKLCAYVNYEDYDKEETRFVLWVMEEYGVENSWSKRFDIMLSKPSILGYTCSVPDTLAPLYLSDNNDLAVTIMGHCTSDVYILMYRNGEASRPLKIVKHEDYKADAFLYVESLITIEKFSEKR